jgi:starch synthase
MPGNNPLNIVMLAAEASPFAKVGGLADVVGSLPKALEKLGAKLTVVIPAYRSARPEGVSIRPCAAIPRLEIPMASSVEHAQVFHARMDQADVEVYLIGSRKYFDREGIYDDPATREGYPDNMERFIFFMKSGLGLLPKLGEPVDIIHCHDSHTALIPGLIKTNFGNHPFFSGTGTLFTIHNLAYQNVFPVSSLDYAGIDRRHFYPMSPFEYWGQVNFMKAGIEFADKINTVSHKYSIEIRESPELGLGLEDVLNRRKEDLSGIVNGVDYNVWNPETDPFIPAHFSSKDLSGKATCKEDLLQYFGLERSRNRVPLIGIVSRLADQKGFDLIAEAVEEMMALDLRLVVLGTGQQKYHDLFQRIASRHSGRIGVKLSFDNELAHRIEAGSDMFLMPSRFEPCGLNQLYSFRYGTIPIVRRTGGLADTVIPFDGEAGNGFVFSAYSAEEMMAAIRQALTVYSDPDQWRLLTTRAMIQDWSWDKSARQYMDLYQSIYIKKHPAVRGIPRNRRCE